MAYKLEHLKLGGILDQAIAVVRDNLGLLTGIMLYAWIPFHVAYAGLQLALTPQINPNATQEELARAMLSQFEYLPLLIGIGFIGSLVVIPLTNAAVIYAVAEKYLGESVTAGQAIRRGLTKLGPLIWTSILMLLAIMGGFVLCIVPGILFALWFGLAQNVVVLEDLSGVSALSRSKQLVQPYLGTFLMVGIIVFVITFLLSGGANLIPQLHVRLMLGIVIQAVATMFSTAAMVVFYFSCRCGLENFDLEHLAATVGSHVGSSETQEPEREGDV